MENSSIMRELQRFPMGVYELPGEPAIVINGVPDAPETAGAIVPSMITNDTQSQNTIGCGEWLEGREVRKLFLGQYYSGIVTKFDKESGWYRVEYEDGDSEDLDWHELEEVLVPLDITMPLKSVALSVIRNREQPPNLTDKYGRKQLPKTKNSGTRRKVSQAGQSDNSEMEKPV